MTTALIDADVIAYMAAFAEQRNVYFIDVFRDGEAVEEFQFVSKEEAITTKEYLEGKSGYMDCNLVIRKEVIAQPAKHAEMCARQIIMKILADTKATDYKLFLTSEDKSNFRYRLAKTKPYKGNRKAAKPVHYQHMRNYLHITWEAYVVVGEEADDALGIEQFEDYCNAWCDADYDWVTHKIPMNIQEHCTTIVASIDKDLKMIPGWHYNIKTGEKVFVNEDNAMRFFWKQMLTGDTVDNIQGVPRIGKKIATSIIEACESLEVCRLAVEQEYKKYYKEYWQEKYNEMGNLLWIKRESNVIFEDLKL